MALTQGSDPIACSLTFRDNNAEIAQFGFYTPNALALVDIVQRVQDVATAAQAVSNASIIGGSISIPLVEETPAAPVAESEVERKLLLFGETESRRQKVNYFLPSPLFTIESAGTNDVSTANPLVAALIDVLTQGRLLPGNGAVSVSGLDVLRIVRATIRHYGRGN